MLRSAIDNWFRKQIQPSCEETDRKNSNRKNNSTAMVRNCIYLLVFTIFFACSKQQTDVKPSEGGENLQQPDLRNIEFDMPEISEPEIPAYEISLAEFGAKPGGSFNNKEAFRKAIAHLTDKGGGRLIVPQGLWLTGPIVLESNIDLHVSAGATIMFSKNKDEYPIVDVSFEGLETKRCMSPITGKNLTNVAITGKGIIDGSGDAWRMVKKSKMTKSQWNKLVKSGGILSDDGKIWYPSEQYKKGAEIINGSFNVIDQSEADFNEIKDFLRPVMVSIVSSENVLLDGPTFQNSPAWNIHPLMCENVIIRNLTVRNPWYSQNGDGLDLESCKNVLVYNNSFDVGDDAICIKSGKNEDGRKRGIPTENVIIQNNVVYHGHGGFVVGSEMSGGVHNIHVSNCTFLGTDVGLRFKSTRGRGGTVSNIYISDINMVDIPTEPIRFNLFYGGQSPILEDDQEQAVPDLEAMEVTEETPSFRDIHMKNITALNSGSVGYFQGLPEMNLKNITIENAYLEGKYGLSLIDADGIEFKDVTINVQKGYPFRAFNVKNIDLKDIKAKSENENNHVLILGSKTDLVNMETSGLEAEKVTVGKEVSGSVKM